MMGKVMILLITWAIVTLLSIVFVVPMLINGSYQPTEEITHE